MFRRKVGCFTILLLILLLGTCRKQLGLVQPDPPAPMPAEEVRIDP